MSFKNSGCYAAATTLLLLASLPVHAATEAILPPDGGPAIVNEVNVPTEFDPNRYPAKPDIQPPAPPKLRGISEDEIRIAGPEAMTDVIIVMAQQPEIVIPAIETVEEYQKKTERELSFNRQTQSRLRQVLTAVGGRLLDEYSILNAIHAILPTRAIALLMSMQEVDSIEDNHADEPKLTTSEPLLVRQEIHIDSAHYPTPVDVSKGSGQVVAVVDSGMEEAHPDLDGSNPVVNGYKIIFHGVYDGSGNYGDARAQTPIPNTHGTSVGGIIAGRGVADSNNRYGIAPAAKLFNLKADSGGEATSVSAINASVNSQTGRDGITGYLASILNVSQGIATTFNPTPTFNQPDGYSAFARSVDNAFENGLVPIVSAGNNGDNMSPLVAKLTTPGDSRKAITVGSLEAVGLAPLHDSGFGPTTDGRHKPELMAPTNVWATHLNIFGNYYHSFSQTSGATPVVSGVAAIVRARFPSSRSITNAGLTLSYLLHSGSSNKSYPFIPQLTGLGLFDADYTFRKTPTPITSGEVGVENVVSQSGLPSHFFAMPTTTTGQFVVTLWWPDRLDTSVIPSQYRHSDLDLRIYNGSGVLVGSSLSTNEVFERIIVPNPILGQTYRVEVQGANVYSNATIGSQQRYYLWMTTLPSTHP